MPTWSELQSFARSRYTLAQDEPGHFGILFAFSNKRGQLIVVRRFRGYDREMIEYTSAICSEKMLSPLDAVKRNAEINLGAIALRGDTYVVRYTQPLAELDLEEFLLPLTMVAHLADQLERAYAQHDVM